MCLGIPMQIMRIDEGARGEAALEGAGHTVDLSLIENPQIGDYVIVHAGFAIERLNRNEAEERLELFDELARTWQAGHAAPVS